MQEYVFVSCANLATDQLYEWRHANVTVPNWCQVQARNTKMCPHEPRVPQNTVIM